jgi:hypothetical protein
MESLEITPETFIQDNSHTYEIGDDINKFLAEEFGFVGEEQVCCECGNPIEPPHAVYYYGCYFKRTRRCMKSDTEMFYLFPKDTYWALDAETDDYVEVKLVKGMSNEGTYLSAVHNSFISECGKENAENKDVFDEWRIKHNII